MGGPIHEIAAASARSSPFGRASPSSCRISTPGRASRKTCSRSASIGWRKAKVGERAQTQGSEYVLMLVKLFTASCTPSL